MKSFSWGFFLFCFLIGVESFAQNLGQGYVASTNVIPNSPEAASLIKFIEVPVSNYTGVPNVNIPITSIANKEISIPISLSYHASGHRVDEMASRVGLGWKLNAGGMITRRVKGQADDLNYPLVKGFLENIMSSTSASYLVGQDQLLYQSIASGCVDIEPDEFYFEVGGYSGKFAFNWAGIVEVSSNADVKISYQIGPEKEIESWEVITPDGLVYTFAIPEYTENETSFSLNSPCTTGPIRYISAWHPTNIRSNNIAGFEIDFSYDDYWVIRDWNGLETRTYNMPGNPVECTGSYGGSSSYSLSRVKIFGKHLKSITDSRGHGRIDFIATKDRTDTLELFEVDNFKSLDQIRIYGASNALLHRYDLQYYDLNRLQLKSVQQIGGNEEIIPPYQFFYENTGGYSGETLPSLISKAIDHWGYYNGAFNNDALNTFLPEYTHFLAPGGPYAHFTGADRDPNEDFAIADMLRKVQYPSGGYVELDFEGHQCSFVSQQTVESEDNYEIISQSSDVAEATGNPNNPNNYVSDEVTFSLPNTQNEFFVKLHFTGITYAALAALMPKASIEDSNGTLVGQAHADVDPDPNDNIPHRTDHVYDLVLPPGDYTLTAEAAAVFGVDIARAWVTWEEINPLAPILVKSVGGVRIKEMRTYDKVNNSPIVKSFSYDMGDGSGYSSGVIYGNPLYVYEGMHLIGRDNSTGNTSNFTIYDCDYIMLLGSSRISLGATNGSHIGYRKVTVDHGVGGGYGQDILHYTSPYEYPDLINDERPFGSPVSNSFKTGLLTLQETLDANGNEVTRMEREYEFLELDLISGKIGFGKVDPPALGAPPVLVVYYNSFSFSYRFSTWFEPLRLGHARVKNELVKRDGVEVLKYYSYDDRLRRILEFKTINSDGKEHRFEYFYPKDSPPGLDTEASLANSLLIDINKVDVPVVSKKYVDNQLVGGVMNLSKTFPGQGVDGRQVIIMPHQTIEIYNDASTRIMGEANYNAEGFVTSLKRLGNPEEIYLWQEDLPIEKTIGGWKWTFQYDPNSRQLISSTDLNDIVSTYQYDGLQRLGIATGRNGGLSTTYDYNYTLAGGSTKNHVSVYDAALKQWTYQYFDGLGRDLQSVQKQYSPKHRDVINAGLYDAYGRMYLQYLPYEGGGEGNYVDPYGPKTRFTFEASPLSREVKRTFADNSKITTTYSSNSTGEVNGYDPNTLYKQVVTDENGHKTETFTDKIGQLILTRRYVDFNDKVDTYNQYDGRGNLIGVMPPETSNSSDPAAYKYTYDNYNRLETKKIPGAGTQSFTYHPDNGSTSDNKLASSTDAKGIALSYTYDAYGRQGSILKAGELMIGNTYDEGSGAVKGKLTKEEVGSLSGSGALATTYQYDQYGRLNATNIQNHQGGVDAFNNSYYGATDIVENLTKVHNGFIKVRERYTYDHSFRLKETWHKVNRDPWVLLSDQGYNHRDELIGKGIGGEKSEFLQSIGYYYNVRGWLTGINLLPLDDREHLAFSGACVSPEDSVRRQECAYDVDLETLLEVRQLEDINVNCFDPCAVAPTLGPVSSLTNNPEDIEAQALSMTVVDNMVATTTAASLTYPTNMYKVDLYEGSRLLLEQELAYVKGGFVIEECAALTGSEQVLDLDYGGEGTVQRSVGQLLSVRSSQSPSFASPSATCDYNPACQSFFGLCNLGPELGGAIQLGLQAGLASTDPNQVTLPTQLYLIQFCDSSTAYYLEEELSMIPGMYATLQEIEVTALDQLFTIVGSNGTQTLTFVEMINLRNTGYEFLIDGYGCAVTYLTQEADCNYRIEQENWVYSNVDNSVQIRVDYDQVIYRDCGNGPEEYSREATSSFIGNSNGKKEVGYQIPFSLGNGFIQSMKLATLNPSDEITVVLHPDSVLLVYPGLSINPSDLYFTNTALFKNALQRVLDYAIANWALNTGIPTPNYLLQIQVSPTAILVYFQVIHNPAGPYVAVNPENSLVKYSPNGETIFDLSANVINTGVSWTTFYEAPCGSSIAVSAYEAELFDTNLPNVWHNLPLASPNPERSLYKLLPDNANCPANTVINLSTSCVDPICIWLGGGHQICCEDTTGCVNCPPPTGTCPQAEKVTAVSVESSQAFANHYQDTTADLREHHALFGLSRVEDDSPWLLRGFDTNDYLQAEVAWDVGRLFLNDGDISIQSWSASVKVSNYFAEGIDVKFGLAVDEALLPLSGGGLFVNLTSAGTLSLNPQDSLSVSQVENIQVVMLVEINSTIATDSFSIDGVWVDITFDGDCPENCVVPGPTCSEEQVIAQLQSLDSLRRMMDTLAMQGVLAIPFPTNLNRVILCDGSAIYLFDHELDILQGGFTIVQTIPIGGTGGTYTVGSGGGSNSESEDLDIEDLFGMELHYQDPNYPLQAFPQYNGNIAWTKWQVKGRDQHYYGYRYDELDRLKRATFGEDIGSQGMQVTNKYTVDSKGAGNSVGQFPTIQYDKRGNILKLRRSGGTGGCEPDGTGGFGWAYTDILDYTYASNNQLINLTDENQLQGGIKYSSSNFEYDANGNLIKDPGKDITEIKYNHLNLPNKITFTQGTTENVIEFSYDAKGTKQVKKVNGTPVKEYLPIGVEYDGDKIEAIYTSEGRVIPMYNPVITDLIDSFRYEWVIRDHLGNGRVYFGDLNEDGQIKVGGLESEVMQEEHYYPFGLNHEGPFYPTQPVANQYLYNGKELNEEFGLGWYNYGFRVYDAAIGRFPSVDPIADQFAFVTPYNYAENSPISNIDLHGLQKFVAVTGEVLGQYKESREIRVLKNNNKVNFLRMVINRPTGMDDESLKFYMSNSIKGYNSEQQAALDWAFTNNGKTHIDQKEHGAKIFSMKISGGEKVFTLGNNSFSRGKDYVDLEFSKPQAEGDWTQEAGIHSHYKTEKFSPYRTPLGLKGDRHVAGEVGGLYLATPGGYLKYLENNDSKAINIYSPIPSSKPGAQLPSTAFDRNQNWKKVLKKYKTPVLKY